MKIGISGTQCTGKTTLLDKILKSELFEKYTLIPEVVRSLKKEKGEAFEFNKSGDFDSQEAILSTHHRNCLKHKDFITDRCAWDAFAYATKNYLDGKFSFKEWKVFEMIFITSMNEYDLLIYLPTNLIELEDDGVRSVDKEYREEMHDMFMWIAERYNLEYILLNDPLEDRLEIVASLLSCSASCEGCKDC